MQLKYLKNIIPPLDGIQKIASSSWSPNGKRLAVCTADRVISKKLEKSLFASIGYIFIRRKWGPKGQVCDESNGKSKGFFQLKNKPRALPMWSER